jgi:hypothetical protein
MSLPATGATLPLIDDGFENGIDPNLYKVHVEGAGTLEIDSTRSREGGRSLHTRLVKSGINNIRQEVVLKKEADSARASPAQGSPFYWLGISIYIPSTSRIASQSVVLQWHTNTENSGASPVVGIRAENNQWRLTTWRAGITVFPGPILTDQWTDWVFRILWRNNATGSIKVWRNGVLVKDQANVQTTWEGENMIPYFKFGRYSSSWRSAGDSDPNGAVHETWHDAVRLAFGNDATYEDVAPRGGVSPPMPPGLLSVG